MGNKASQRRQKRQAKKTAKRKAKRAAAGAVPAGKLVSRSLRGRYPIHECLAPAHLFDKGIGTVVVSRRAPRGAILWSGFLMDVWCLGVKDAFARVEPEDSYDDALEDMIFRESLEMVEPAYAKKLILDAVTYAQDLGFSPHPDYREASSILATIDHLTCSEMFTFGRNGKPCFSSGPNDTPARCRQIFDTLEKRLGREGFEFVMNDPLFPGASELGPGSDLILPHT